MSQIIAILTLPVLSRMYDPSDYGKLAVIMAVSNIAGVVLALRYEMAIMLPKQNKIAFLVMIQVMFLALLLAIVELLVLSVLFKHIMTSYGDFLYLIVLVSFSNIIFQSSVLWFNRHKKFYLSSIFTVLKVVSIFIFQFSLHDIENGLIWGYFYGDMIILAVLLMLFLKNFISYQDSFSKNKFYYLFIRYKKFPIYSLPASLMNICSNNIHIILIEHFFNSFFSGLFSMALRLFYAPVNLISSTLSNVIYQNFTFKLANKQSVHREAKKLLIYISIVALMITCLMFLVYQMDIVTFLLGDDWRDVNDILPYFAILLFLNMIGSSLGVFAIYEKEEIALLFQSILLITTITSIVLAYFLGYDFFEMLFAFSVGISAVYALQIYLKYTLAQRTKHYEG